MRFDRIGFTLIELIIVIIIIAALAVIAAPMMSANVAKARRSEAVAACGALRGAARIYAVENNGAYPTDRANLANYIGDSDLNGPNYTAANYTISGGLIKADAGTQGAGWVNLNMATGALDQGD